MPSDIPLDYHDRATASDTLADNLSNGTLALFVGAGASRCMGLPLWWELVKRCVDKIGPPDPTINEGTSNEKLRSLMEAVEKKAADPERYMDLVHECLYDGVTYDQDVIVQKLLIAFGALLMPSRRGHIKEVVSFNYDDVLEWYLRVHGFKSQVICKLPQLCGDSDVTVYHPHGYLPKMAGKNERSDSIVLSQYSYDERMSDQEPWKNQILNILLSRFGLFVGLSGDDPTFGPFLMNVKKQIRDDRPTGFWLLTNKDSKKPDHFISRNVVPIYFENPEEFAPFLLDICQKAARMCDY